jgi:hypothetical protein
MTRRVVLFIALLSTMCSGTRVSAQGHIPTWKDLDKRNTEVNRLREAVDLYRSGHGAEALAMMDEWTPDQQAGLVWLVGVLVPQLLDGEEDKLPPGYDKPTVKLKRWTIGHYRAFGAMQMEALLRGYVLRGARGSAGFNRTRMEDAESLFDLIGKRTGEASPAPRWELAIGLTAFKDRQIGWANAVLGFGCRMHPGDRELKLACGSVEGMMGAQSADLLMESVPAPTPRLTPRTPGDPLPRTNPSDLLYQPDTPDLPGRLHRQHLDKARDLLGDIVKEEPSNVEARLRLAHAQIEAREDRAAVAALQPIVSGTLTSDVRAQFLACLFQAGIEQRAGRFDAAAALLDRAVSAVPSGQSALVVRVALERVRGDAAAASAALDRMFHAPAEPPDPWLDFHRGQHWSINPLLAALRAEARQ